MKAFIAMTCLIAGSCSAIPGTEANTEKQARAALRMTLYDSDSARFANAQAIDAKSPHAGKLLCGEVNAKNKLGAYIGFRNFFAYPAENLAGVDPRQEGGAEQRAFNAGRREARAAGCRFS